MTLPKKNSQMDCQNGWSSSQPHQPFGEYAYTVLKFRKISVVAYDFAFGWSAWEFHKVFEDSGGRVFKRYGSIDRQDMSPYLSRFRRRRCRFRGLLWPADDAIRQAVPEFGLKGNSLNRRGLPRMNTPFLHGDEAIESSPRCITAKPSTTRPTRNL